MRKKQKNTPKPLPPHLDLLTEFVYDHETGILTKRSTGRPVGWTDKRGYRHVRFRNVTYKLHRIVYKMFHGIDPGKKVVDHRDGNPTNNRIDNLRCVHRRANVRNTITRRQINGLPSKDINCTKASKRRFTVQGGHRPDF